MNKRWTLDGKYALVTGGSKGIGKAIVEEYLSHGAEVVFTARNQETIDKTLSELESKGLAAHGLEADVCSEKEMIAVFDFIRNKWNKLDILVNNAGTNIRKGSMEYSKEEYDFLIDTNLRSVFDISRMAYPLLKEACNSSIINIGSSAGSNIVRTGAPYAQSKAALAHLSRYFSVEWAEDGIRCNCIEPWYISTPLTRPVLEDTNKLEKILEITPMGRVGQPDEISGLAAFLAMEASSYISGQVTAVDGSASNLMF